jgi:hypothetical protein
MDKSLGTGELPSVSSGIQRQRTAPTNKTFCQISTLRVAAREQSPQTSRRRDIAFILST